MSMQDQTSPFDDEAFVGEGSEDVGQTTLTPIEAGTYPAVIEEMKRRTGTSKKTNEAYVSLDVTYLLTDDGGAIKEKIGRDPRVTQSYFVDLNAAGGYDYSKGKNIAINRVREAVGQNVAGQKWNPFMMKGQPITVVVVEDPQPNSDVIYNRVKSVGKFE